MNKKLNITRNILLASGLLLSSAFVVKYKLINVKTKINIVAGVVIMTGALRINQDGNIIIIPNLRAKSRVQGDIFNPDVGRNLCLTKLKIRGLNKMNRTIENMYKYYSTKLSRIYSLRKQYMEHIITESNILDLLIQDIPNH